MPAHARPSTLARSVALLGLTRLSHERRAMLRRRARAQPLRGLTRLAGGETVVAAGLARGLRLAPGAPPFDHVHAHHILRGTLEQPVQEALRRTLAAGAVFYDIGANVGFFSLVGARLVGPGGRVVAFEPVPQSAALARANAAANGLDWIEVRQVAVAASRGNSELCVVDEASWSRLTSYGLHPRTEARVTVDVVAVDELVRGGLRVPDVVKIDAEGAELEILAGMSETLAAAQPAIICELHATNRQFGELMRDSGYVSENLDGPAAVAEAGPTIHVLARPAAQLAR